MRSDSDNQIMSSRPNFIHPTSVIHPSVQMGQGNHIGPFCYFGAGVQIGDDNHFTAYCSIGQPPEHKGFWFEDHASVRFGHRCVVREFVAVGAGTVADTSVGNGISLLKGCYVGHDSILEDDVTLASNAAIGGHVRIHRGANLGMNSAVHQYARIGHYAMLGMGGIVTKTSVIEPLGVYIGSPARFLKTNQHAIRKFNLAPKEIEVFQAEFARAVLKAAS